MSDRLGRRQPNDDYHRRAFSASVKQTERSWRITVCAFGRTHRLHEVRFACARRGSRPTQETPVRKVHSMAHTCESGGACLDSAMGATAASNRNCVPAAVDCAEVRRRCRLKRRRCIPLGSAFSRRRNDNRGGIRSHLLLRWSMGNATLDDASI